MVSVRLHPLADRVYDAVDGGLRGGDQLSLRYVRERRERIPLRGFFEEIIEFYRPRFGNRGIEVQLDVSQADGMTLLMNRGKLVQVIDNLFLNSEYWLREELRLGNVEHGVIAIELQKPFVRISDNGRGIDPSVEHSLFEPFVTAKGRGKGRGLGLFIVQQLLDSEECSISLLPLRNARGCMYVFEIDLSGALVGSDQ